LSSQRRLERREPSLQVGWVAVHGHEACTFSSPKGNDYPAGTERLAQSGSKSRGELGRLADRRERAAERGQPAKGDGISHGATT
jgi:hypothetical protein